MREKIKRIWLEDKFYIIFLLVIMVLFNYRLPYYVTAPGGTININDRIEYEDKYEYDGSLNMLYVTQYEATVPIYLASYLFEDWDLEKLSDNQISSENHKEIDLRNKIMLDSSINNAMYVAYSYADKKIEIEEKKNFVVATFYDMELEIGDRILEVENNKINSLEDLKRVISLYEIDDILNVKILRDNKLREVEVLVRDVDGVKGIGVVMMTTYEYDVDPDIELKFKRSESGSSGGLMMALSIYSAISGEDILKGRNIAGTGTIDINGNVGAIDGIKYKIMGAVKDDMDIVLVPSANYDEARDVVEDKNYNIELVEIKTFDDAIEYLIK